MAHAIIIDRSATWKTRNKKLEALKVRNVSTPDNQQLLGDGDLNRIMDPDLYEATKNGDVDKFIDALEGDLQSRGLALSLIFDQVTPAGNSLLHVAASLGKEDIMEFILFHFPDLMTRKNSLDDTLLHVAVRDGELEVIRKLIRPRRDLEIIYWKNKDSKSPLYLAAKTGHLEILELLLEAYAQDEAYAVKIQGMSPILAAIEDGKPDILEKIIDRLPKLLHVLDEDGRAPLHYAASNGKLTKIGQWSSTKSADAVECLLRKCRYLALQKDKNGSYPIHIACKGGHVDIIRKLVKTWPDLAEVKNKKGQNILHNAAEGGNNDAVRYILKECGKPDVIEKLVNTKDADGNTPLHLAWGQNHCKVMLHLIRDGRVNLEHWNNSNSTIRDVFFNCANSSTKYPVSLGAAILIVAGVWRPKIQDVRLPKKHIEWVNDQVNSLLLVATLVTTVTFAAGFTLPGGYNVDSDPNSGTAAMLHDRFFQVFVISNTVAMYSAINVLVVLIGCHQEIISLKQAEVAYALVGAPLVLSITCMSVAFTAAAIVAVRELPWLALLVLFIAAGYLIHFAAIFAALTFPFFFGIGARLGSIFLVVIGFVLLPREAAVAFWQLMCTNWRRLLFEY